MLFLLSHANAEQDLPIYVEDGRTVYKSQLNYIEAYDRESNKLLWETVVFPDLEPESYVWGLEHDVQWTVINRLEIEGTLLRVTDSKEREYYLNKSTGKLVEEK